MYGESYVGYTQYAAACMRPPGLVTINPTVTFTQPYDMTWHGGAFCLGTFVSWSLGSVASMALMRHTGPAAERERLAAEWANAMDGMARGDSFSAWPPDDMPVIGRDGWAPYLADTISQPVYDDYWQSIACPPRDARPAHLSHRWVVRHLRPQHDCRLHRPARPGPHAPAVTDGAVGAWAVRR